MAGVKRLSNILRYGFGPNARARKRAVKEERRRAQFDNGALWERGAEGAVRKYTSYAEYLTHQAAKLDGIVDRLRETEAEDFAEFRRRFETCKPLAGARAVLCLGARLGTEVRALHSLGHFAVGIDLNPGPANPYVLPGDFHHIVFPDGSADAIYCNALDHVFDLDRFLGEVRRLLRPGGIFVVDLVAGYEEGFVPGPFEARLWRDSHAFIAEIAARGSFETVETRDLGVLRLLHWTQAVFRRSA
jgi:SAM-dependent methyltransferase